MVQSKDVRWIQRYSNYRKALVKLTQAVNIITGRVDGRDDVDELLKEGLIQRFEYTHELAWKVMKDYAEYQGYTEVRGSRDAFRQALQMGIIDDAAWMESIEDRNLTSHNYDEEVAEEVYEAIVHKYYPLFVRFEQKMYPLTGAEPTLFWCMPYGLNDKELHTLQTTFAANAHIDRVILYGSRAKGNYKPFSDVDIVLVGDALSRTDINRLYASIDESSLPYKFDISLLALLKSEELIAHIERVGITIYKR